MLQRFAIMLSAAGLVVSVACAQSDAGITTAVKSKLAADDEVKAYQIDVDTANRVVTLSGTVETAVAKDQAITLARQTDGVRDVVDNVTVNAEAAATTGDIKDEAGDAARDAATTVGDAAQRTGAVLTDAAITSAVKGKFLADTAVSGLKIDVDTTDGVVTLTGNVATSAEVDRAVSLARNTDGVKRVANDLRVNR